MFRESFSPGTFYGNPRPQELWSGVLGSRVRARLHRDECSSMTAPEVTPPSLGHPRPQCNSIQLSMIWNRETGSGSS